MRSTSKQCVADSSLPKYTASLNTLGNIMKGPPKIDDLQTDFMTKGFIS